MLRPSAPPGDFVPTPLWLFGSAFLAYAAFCLLMARQQQETFLDPHFDLGTSAESTKIQARCTDSFPASATHNLPPVVARVVQAPPGASLFRNANVSSWRKAWTFWAHFSVFSAVLFAVVTLVLPRPNWNDFALLSLS